MTQIRKAVPPPQERCEECHELKPSFGFVNLSSQEKGTSRALCPACYNRDYMQRAGLPQLEVSEFEPITRFDWLGKAHTFHFAVMLTSGLGIRASEWFKDGPGGYKFAVMEHPEAPVREAYERLVHKIEAGLAEGYVESSDFPPEGTSQNRLYIRGSALNGRVEERRNGDPSVVVDGREYSWTELGRMLGGYTGYNFRLECFSVYEDPEITANPKRPNRTWWLDLPEREDEDRTHH